MRTIAVVGVFVLVVLEIGWTIYEFLVIHEGIEYFTASPYRLLYPAAIGMIGGGLLAVVCRLPHRVNRTLGLLMLGVIALACTVLLGITFYHMTTLPPYLTGADFIDGFVLVLVSFTLAALFFWWEFAVLLRRTPDHNRLT